jgi:GT2 family glycosyltransferase
MEKIFIHILNYKRYDKTIECIHSLLKLDTSNLEIVIAVTDNNSQNSSLELIANSIKDTMIINHTDSLASYNYNSLKGKILLFQNNQNPGFGGGHNYGINKIKNWFDPDFYWLLNNDLTCKSDALLSLVNKASESNKYGIIGSLIKPDNHSQTTNFSIGAILNLYNGESKEVSLNINNSYQQEITRLNNKCFAINGCALFIRQDLMKLASNFDERYFLYFEEYDLSTKARKLGFYTVPCLDSEVYHDQSVTTGKNNYTTIYYPLLSKILFFKKNYPLYLPLALAYSYFRLLLGFGLKFKWKEVKWITSALVNGLINKY